MDIEGLLARNAESVNHIYAAKKKFYLRNGVLAESNSKILIGHFSDIHADKERFENLIKCFEYFNVAFAIHTGDTVIWDMREDVSFFKDMTKDSPVPFYNCIGNHETFRDTVPVKNKELYEKLLTNQKDVCSESDGGYYYVDFPKYGIRLITLNNYEFDDTDVTRTREAYNILQPQCEWLIAALKDAKDKGYGVIIASHEADIPIPENCNDFGFCQRYQPYPWSIPKEHEHIVADIIDAFKYGKKLDIDFTWESTGAHVSIKDEFEGSGEFICYLNGHRHGDYVGHLPGFPDQLSIGMPCSGCYPEGYHNIGEEISDLPRVPNTVTEDCINFYSIDREERTIAIVRLGATVNDEFETRRSLKLKY